MHLANREVGGVDPDNEIVGRHRHSTSLWSKCHATNAISLPFHLEVGGRDFRFDLRSNFIQTSASWPERQNASILAVGIHLGFVLSRIAMVREPEIHRRRNDQGEDHGNYNPSYYCDCEWLKHL